MLVGLVTVLLGVVALAVIARESVSPPFALPDDRHPDEVDASAHPGQDL